ncbi:unnamed protein product [Urochloa humidicola]
MARGEGRGRRNGRGNCVFQRTGLALVRDVETDSGLPLVLGCTPTENNWSVRLAKPSLVQPTTQTLTFEPPVPHSSPRLPQCSAGPVDGARLFVGEAGRRRRYPRRYGRCYRGGVSPLAAVSPVEEELERFMTLVTIDLEIKSWACRCRLQDDEVCLFRLASTAARDQIATAEVGLQERR